MQPNSFETMAELARKAVEAIEREKRRGNSATVAASSRVSVAAGRFLVAHEDALRHTEMMARLESESEVALEQLAVAHEAVREVIRSRAPGELPVDPIDPCESPGDLLLASRACERILARHPRDEWACGLFRFFKAALRHAASAWVEEMEGRCLLGRIRADRRMWSEELVDAWMEFRSILRTSRRADNEDRPAPRILPGKHPEPPPSEPSMAVAVKKAS